MCALDMEIPVAGEGEEREGGAKEDRDHFYRGVEGSFVDCDPNRGR